MCPSSVLSLFMFLACGIFAAADNSKAESGGHSFAVSPSEMTLSVTGPRSTDAINHSSNSSTDNTSNVTSEVTSTSKSTEIVLIVTVVVVSVAIIILIIILILLWREANADPNFVVSISTSHQTRSWFKIHQPDDPESEPSPTPKNSLSQSKFSLKKIERSKSRLPPLVVSGHLDSVISDSTNKCKPAKAKQLAGKSVNKAKCAIRSKSRTKVSAKVNTAKCA